MNNLFILAYNINVKKLRIRKKLRQIIDKNIERWYNINGDKGERIYAN